MQKFMLFVCTLAIAGSTYAQDAKTYKTKFSGANKRVIMDIDAKQLDIEGYNGDEIIIEATNVPSVPKEADGLRPLSAGGIDNTGAGLSVYPNGDVLKINVVMKGKALYKIKMPKELALVIKKRNSCSCNETGMSIIGMEGSIEVNTNYESITLTDVSGPIVANSHQGKIKIIYDEKMPDKPSSIVSYNSNVDVTVSEKAKVLFSISSSDGNMFTDLDLKPYIEPAKTEEKSTKQLQDEVIANAVKDRTRAITINGQSVGKDAGWGSTSSATNAFPNVYYWSGNDWATNNTNIAANSAAPTSYLSWNDADKGFPKYVLNEGQTKILIRTINGNVYLRKKK
ncbi:hypothetical protein [Runella sp.]|jgi:hypothetical protein|uniref:hypothetical protein n=1 Tax=Runella sp. TaxID=1960881 RepID=UPI0030172CD3